MNCVLRVQNETLKLFSKVGRKTEREVLFLRKDRDKGGKKENIYCIYFKGVTGWKEMKMDFSFVKLT